MTMPMGFHWLGRCATATVLAVGFATMGSAIVNVGDRPSGAWAQSANPTAASLIAAIRSSADGTLSPALQNNLASYLNALPARQAAEFIGAVITTSATSGAGSVGLSGNVAQALVTLPGLTPAAAFNVGNGMGQAVGILAANNYGLASSSIATKVTAAAPPGMGVGLGAGLNAAILAVPKASAALAAALPPGTVGSSGVVGVAPPTPFVVNPNQVTPCTTGSCN